MRLQPPKARITHQIIQPVDGADAFLYGGTYDALKASYGNKRSRGGGYKTSGPFWVYKHHHRIQQGPEVVIRDGWGSPYKCRLVSGSALSRPFEPILPTKTPDEIFGDLKQYYATGYARTRPDKREADVSVFIAELRQLPTLPLRLFNRLRSIKALGSEYLNVQFGWAPLVRDIQAMYGLQQKIGKRLKQLRDENRKIIRRTATIERTASHNFVDGGTSWPFYGLSTLPPNYLTGSGSHSKLTAERSRVWFVGKYIYYLPDDLDHQWDARARRALFGFGVTPGILWQALPWSWLIGWFSNLQDVLNNLSPGPLDGLTLTAGYTMKQTVYTELLEASGYWEPSGTFSVSNSGSYNLSTVIQIENKSRILGGNPFGVEFDSGKWTPFQMSILAALGASRSNLKSRLF